MTTAFDSKEFRRACGEFLTGVTIVTTRDADGNPVGLTANAFSSVSLDPPMVLVCVDKKAGSFPALQQAKTYAVHILAEEQQELSSLFATKGSDRFSNREWSEGLGGAPIFPGYLALFECNIAHAHEGGDHIIFVGHVERFDIQGDTRRPLGFFRGKYTTNAD